MRAKLSQIKSRSRFVCNSAALLTLEGSQKVTFKYSNTQSVPLIIGERSSLIADDFHDSLAISHAKLSIPNIQPQQCLKFEKAKAT